MPTLTCAVLTESYVKAEELFADSAKKQDYVANVESANAIIENTTAKLEIITDDKKQRTAKIYWNKFCNSTVSTSAPNFCSFTGTEADADCKSYVIDKVVSKAFTIDEGNYQGSNLDFALVYADNLLKVMKYLDEKVASVGVASLDSFAQPNLFEGGIGCPDGSGSWIETFINAGYWSPDIIGYFLQTAKLNKFSSPFLLDGSNLFQHYWKAQMNAKNSNGDGAKTMFDQLKYYSDLFNVDAVSNKATYMVDRGSVAFASKPYWSAYTATNPKQGAGDLMKYSEPSKNIKGLTYDIYIKETCSGRFSKYDVLVVAEYGIYNGAAACDGSTGVLKFTCGVCP